MGLIINPYRYGGGGGGGGTHTYWRLRFPQGINGGNDNRTQLQTVEFRATVGGADQCTGGTAFASAVHGSSSAASAFDANSGTAWFTAGNDHFNSYIGYQFASPVAVEQISLTGSSDTSYSPRSIIVEHSDDGSTYTIYAFIPPTLSWSANETKTFTTDSYPPYATAYRYWKIEVTASNDGAGDVLAQEIELRAAASGPDLTAPGGNAPATQASGTAGHYSANEGPDKAFNNNTGDWWQPRMPGGGGVVYCVWDFGAGNSYQIEQIQWTAHPSFLGRSPNEFKVYGSNDGSSWTQDWTTVSCGTWSGSVRTFDR